MADNSALLSLLGLCKKANKLSCGHDAAVESIHSGQAEICLMSSDSSQRLRDEIKREISMSKREIQFCVTDSTMDEIGHAVRLRSAVITVNDSGFAKSVSKLTHNERREENEC
ncbi:MAG: ribosomal L7Ae/L30e/S12e/Gadd45 family protein [Clostridia bacterium]|nr:ribosomal L7Ae/L30e/S12e/Gadd45 family protein [Clostridia bacterium]